MAEVSSEPNPEPSDDKPIEPEIVSNSKIRCFSRQKENR